jgi:hypothetical protein
LIAKANAGDVIWFMATLNRIAEILRLQGDLDSADGRRSKAIGILAQSALALQLLWEFRNQHHPAAEPQQPNEPINNESPGWVRRVHHPAGGTATRNRSPVGRRATTSRSP